jgi:hypothetical protein
MAEVKDVDYFRSDPIFRNLAGREQQNLYDTLSGFLYERENKYRQLENDRANWNTNRNKSGTQTAENFAARGLGRSGLYKQGLDESMKPYEESANAMNTGEQDLVTQYGQRASLAQMPAMNAIADQDYNALASIYGLLGSKGVSAGNQYTGKVGSLRAESAGRSNEKLINTLGW